MRASRRRSTLVASGRGEVVPAVVEHQPGRDGRRVGRSVAAPGEEPQPAAAGPAECGEQGADLVGVGVAHRAGLAERDPPDLARGERRQQVGALVAMGLLVAHEQVAGSDT